MEPEPEGVPFSTCPPTDPTHVPLVNSAPQLPAETMTFEPSGMGSPNTSRIGLKVTVLVWIPPSPRIMEGCAIPIAFSGASNVSKIIAISQQSTNAPKGFATITWIVTVCDEVGEGAEAP